MYGTAVYFTYHYMKMKNGCAACVSSNESHVHSPQRNLQYQNVANCYDDSIGRDEFFMGMNILRRSLLYFHAKGTVLEVGAGTGRNLSYYGTTVDRVVLSDTCTQMLNQARQKIREMGSINRKRFAVLEADSANLKLPNDSFDTVVDTFGLCSYDDPVAVLQELSRVCKPGGKILLLEHGRSKSWQFVTDHLDKFAEVHAANWGCVWNRDLDDIVQMADLEVDVLRRWHFGTTYYMVCRPKKVV